MNLTWHIILKDLRHLRLGLGLWTLTIVAQIFFAERLLSSAAFEPGWFERQQIIMFLTIVVSDIFAFFLTAAIVLEDSLVGTRMFWVTRPISGARLLAAKSLAILLVVVLWPVALALPWWIYCGYGVEQLLVAARFAMLNHGIIALAAVALAALAGEGSRFLVWTLTLLIALPMLIATIANSSDAFVPTDVATSRVVLLIALLTVAALTVIWIQFRTRRVGRALVAIGLGAGLAVLVSVAWPWNLVRLWPQDTRQREDTEGIKVELLAAKIIKPTLAKPRLALSFRVTDLPPGFILLPGGRIEATLAWSDGTTFQNAGTIQSESWNYSLRQLLHLPEGRPDPETALKIAERATEKRQPAGDRPAFTGSIPLSAAWADRLAAEPPASCKLRLRITTARPEVALEVPWNDAVGQTPEGLRLRQIRMDHTKVGARKAGGAKGTAAKGAAIVLISRPTRLRDLQYRVVNLRDGTEALVSSGGPTTAVPAAVMPVHYDFRTVSTIPPRVWRTNQWVPLPGWEEWLDAASLVFITFKEDGGFNREVTTDHLVVTSQ